ncbi:MAG TPA: monovalent cation/H(+) antiporter subunit G [Stellaceae bacterium]|nr:monovalent cation/H(+) antiporter subunit G [Stellaceae bacterium]
MSAAQLAEIVLLALGVAALWLAAFGMLLLPNALARLHCVSFAGAAGAFCFPAAVVIERGGNPLGLKSILLAILLLLSGAVVVHATGRGLRYRRQFRDEDA